MTVQIKICGLSTPEALEAAIEAGATHVGFVHFEKSPRHVSLEQAAELRYIAGARVKTVLLTANADVPTVSKGIEQVRPDILQFHGSETPEWIGLIREKIGIECWKALGLKDAGTLERCAKFHGKVDRLLFDAPAKELPGGNGETFRWELLEGHDHQVDWGLAGGLTPANVADAIRATGAPLVDTSSGVESAPGVKDVDLIRAFCKAALSA
ncbi:phosphoribosylanthranilate isomerase [Altererythrobacter arenosus]|uniref:N-(5'-phosphoribosyl)anthranilate isomerase n=1 Tax=Altererythrobacter arenosus TaxID=3032592 RepID=A0ABY8FS68_9SPHN|nr:phosphoribosylanthranilate isomerase [Altererythrobacter sp. CAU 1644]WFL76758.1 phosphoribosylanthranilate isomerase [Altererythrobacter sp. CAU 1644]